MRPQNAFRILAFSLLLSGCATLFGWDIHAPGVLSQRFYERVEPLDQRIGLYLDPSFSDLISKNKGGRFADPQTYYIGEAYVPLVIEGFQRGFGEFLFLEDEPRREVLAQYGIAYAVYIRPRAFTNDVTLKGQKVGFESDTFVFDADLNLLDRFQTTGTSDSKKVFAKRGGPQVNLNGALENNVESIVLHIQDAVRSGRWKKGAA